MTGSSLSSASASAGKAAVGTKFWQDPSDSIGPVGAQAGQREIDAGAKGKSWQKPRAAYVRKKADADFGHREDEALTGHRMGGVHSQTNTPAHDNAVHQGDDWFRIGLDPQIELIFLTPKSQLGVMIARAAEVVEAQS